MQFIADELGVAKGTVYRYYSTKEELFFAAVDEGMQQLNLPSTRPQSMACTSLERVELGIMAYLKYFDQHPDVIELIIQEQQTFVIA